MASFQIAGPIGGSTSPASDAGTLVHSSVAKLVNEPTAVTGHASLEAARRGWNKPQGELSKDLDNRRAAEWRIDTAAVYARW